MQPVSALRFAVKSYREALRTPFLEWMKEEESIETFLGRSFAVSFRAEALFEAIAAHSDGANSKHRTWAIVDLSFCRLVGHIECKATPKAQGDQLEVIYAVRSGFRRIGVATEALSQVSRIYAAESVGLVAIIKTTNAASRRVLQKANFVLHASEETPNAEKWFLAPPAVAR